MRASQQCCCCKSNALLYLSKSSATFSSNEVITERSTFACNEVRFLANFITFTLLLYWRSNRVTTRALSRSRHAAAAAADSAGSARRRRRRRHYGPVVGAARHLWSTGHP